MYFIIIIIILCYTLSACYTRSTPPFVCLLLVSWLVDCMSEVRSTESRQHQQQQPHTRSRVLIYGNWTCNGIGNIKKLIPIDFHEKILICRLNYNAHRPSSTHYHLYGGVSIYRPPQPFPSTHCNYYGYLVTRSD